MRRRWTDDEVDDGREVMRAHNLQPGLAEVEPREQAEAVCVECGYGFRYQPAWWIDKGLAFPARCLRCRQRRRREPPPRTRGVVVELRFGVYGFLEDEAGRRYYFALDSVRAGDRPLERGAKVTFEPSSDETPPPKGRCPKAYVVAREV